jgi:cobalt-zinc-cadmium efflux system outer membrane protein
MLTRRCGVVMALLCAATPVAAQNVLTESDALSRLSIDSPRVRAIRAGVDVARAEALAAGRWPNPRATVNREAVAGVAENMVTVTQPLPVTGRRGFEVGAANALAEAASHRADDAVRRARSEMRRAYADLVAAQLREQEMAAARDRVAQVAQVLARREAAGDAAGYDRLRTEREVMDLETEVSNARSERARAQGALASFFAAPADPIVAVPPAITSRPALPSVDELLQRARTTRGEAIALQQEGEAARLAERAANRRVIPEPEIVAGTKSSNAAGGDTGSVISVHAAIPLFDRARPERALARARTALVQAQSAAFEQALAAQVRALRGLVAERREAADRYRATAASATELERIAQVSYDAGERGILELLDAYRSSTAVRQRQAALDAAVRQAEIDLEFLTGWEMQ